MKRNTIFVIIGIALGLCLLTAIFSALAFRTYFNLKKEGVPPVSTSVGSKPIQHLERPDKPLIVEDTAIVCIRDIRGAEVQLYTYLSKCLENRDEIDYQGAWLREVFEESDVLPVRKFSGLIHMIEISQISEYYFDGEKASISLNNKMTVDGYPVGDYSISGRSALGEVSLMVTDIHMAKFNSNAIPKLKNKNSKYTASKAYEDSKKIKIYYDGGYWPGETASQIRIVTLDDQTELINQPVFVYQLNGCDNGWIPCKPFTTWKITDCLPIQYGMIKTKIKLSEMKSVTFSYSNDSLLAEVTMAGGKTISGSSVYQGAGLLDNDFSYLVGILGVAETGTVYMRLKNIKSIQLNKPS
jgi:hypothetical protein